MVRMLVVLLGHLVGLQILGETRFPVEQVEILVPVVWEDWGNSPLHTVAGLYRILFLDLHLLVCVCVLGLVETLGREILGFLFLHHSH